MKKIFLLLISAGAAVSTFAQAQNANMPDTTKKMVVPTFTHDRDLSRFVVDINLLGGLLSQTYTTANSAGNYTNGLNVNQGNLKFNNGSSFGFDAQFGYFFGKSCHWGIGAGIMYMAQQGDAKLDNFHAEYQATDPNGNIYRQIVDGYNVKESLNITNINIPVVLKYKNRFSKRWGFSGDIGALFNTQFSNSYKSDASFDYGAAIKLSNTANGQPWLYDGGATPASTDFLITRAHYLAEHPDGDVNAYFQGERNAGYNVGLGVKPNSNTGTVTYKTGSVGFIVQPSMSYYISDNFALNFGLYYTYQSINNNNLANYRLTNGMGDYSSVLNNTTKSVVQSYGINVGVRFLFGKLKDTDGDGIPDKRDNCPTVWGLPQFNGCPDTDGDGIQDSEDSCVTVPGLVQFHGCPDTDGDGIPDKDDECPYQAGPKQFHGCPDRDGDGIPDKDDACPDKAGLAQFHGCPDTDGDGIPDSEDQCPTVAGPASNHGCPVPAPVEQPIDTVSLSSPILFELGKAKVHKSSFPILESAVNKLQDDKDFSIVINGYTDITGKPAFNKRLSIKRAYAVKKYLVDLGADPKRIKIIGHGSKNPAASNSTPEGRMENRRAVMQLNTAGR